MSVETEPGPEAILTLRTRRMDDRVVVALAGELESSSTRILRAELDRLAGTTRRIVLDLAALEFIDSSGIGEVVRAQQTLRNDFCDLTVVDPSSPVARAIDVMGLRGQLEGDPV